MSAMSLRSRLVLALAALAVGCSAPSGACIELSEEDLLLAAYITDDGVKARAEVEVRRSDDEDGGVPLRLCDKSALYVDGVRATRVRRPSGASVYRADLKVRAGDVATRHTLRLVDGEHSHDYEATLDAPAFAITSPAAGVELSRTAMWDLAWEPARPDATIRARVDDVIDGETCLGAPIELELPDAGNAKIGSGQVEVAKTGLAAVDKCDAYIQLARLATAPLVPTGGAASRLHPDSFVEAATSRELPFLSVP